MKKTIAQKIKEKQKTLKDINNILAEKLINTVNCNYICNHNDFNINKLKEDMNIDNYIINTIASHNKLDYGDFLQYLQTTYNKKNKYCFKPSYELTNVLNEIFTNDNILKYNFFLCVKENIESTNENIKIYYTNQKNSETVEICYYFRDEDFLLYSLSIKYIYPKNNKKDGRMKYKKDVNILTGNFLSFLTKNGLWFDQNDSSIKMI